MRILAVMNLYPPHSYGGYEALCAGAVESWRRVGHEVHVITSTWRRSDLDRGANSDGQDGVERLLPIYWDDHNVVEVSVPTALRWERRARRTVRQTLSRFRPDVLSVWNAAALPLGIFDVFTEAGLPTVLVIGDRWLEFAVTIDGWHGRAAIGELPRWAGLVSRRQGSSLGLPTLGVQHVACFASGFLRERALASSSWPLDDVALVPHGPDLDRYPITSRPERPWGGHLLYVGRIAREKGILTGVRALAHLEDVVLDVVGGGQESYRHELLKEARELGVADRLRLLGQRDAAGLREAYLEADALVFPSQWEEPFGIVPLEAMACGLPVLGTGTGGSGEFLVDGVTALRFPPRDDVELASAIRRLAGDSVLRENLAQAGLCLASWLSRDRTYAELLEWHAWVLGERTTRPVERSVLPPELADVSQ